MRREAARLWLSGAAGCHACAAGERAGAQAGAGAGADGTGVAGGHAQQPLPLLQVLLPRTRTCLSSHAYEVRAAACKALAQAWLGPLVDGCVRGLGYDLE